MKPLQALQDNLSARKISTRLAAVQALQEHRRRTLANEDKDDDPPRAQESAAQLIHFALFDPHPSVQEAAEEALSGDTEGLSGATIVAQMHSHPQAFFRRAIAAALAPGAITNPGASERLSSLTPEESIRALCSLLVDTNESVRKQAQQSLSEWNTNKPDGAELAFMGTQLEQLRRAGLRGKVEAIEALAEGAQRLAFDAVQRYIEGRQDKLQRAFLRAILQLDARRYILWVLDLLLFQPYDDQALDATALQALKTLHTEEDRDEIQRTLTQHTSETYPMGVRERAVWLMGALGWEGSISCLKKTLQNPSIPLSLQVEATSALVELDLPAAKDALQVVFQQAGPPLNVHIACALCLYQSDEGVALLRTQLQRRDAAIPHSVLLEALSHLQQESLIPLFIDRLEQTSQSDRARLSAIDGLGKLRAKEANYILREMLLDHNEHELTRTTAAAALAQIFPTQLDPIRDERLRLTLDFDRNTHLRLEQSSLRVLKAFRTMARHITKRLEELEADHFEEESKTEVSQYLEGLRQRNRQILPTLQAYRRATQEDKRYRQRRGEGFVALAVSTQEAWMSCSAMLNEVMASGIFAPNLDSESFSKLRQLLSLPPSSRNWLKLCQFLDEWPEGAELELALDYADEHLEGWPIALRQPQHTWYRDMLGMQFQPRFRIVRTMVMNTYTHIPREKLTFLENLQEPYVLEELNLQENGFTSSGARALAKCASLQSVKELNLFYNNIGAKGLVLLLASPYLTQLEAINLQSNNLGNKGVLLLAQEHNWRSLKRLNLTSNRISDKGAEALAASTILTSLEELYIGNNAITPAALEALRRSPAMQGTRIHADDEQREEDLPF